MTWTGDTFMGLDSHQTRPSQRLAAYLRGRYRREHQAKRLAADIGSTPKAAENILAGHWPCDRHFGAIVRRFGRDVLDAVFAPDINETLARLNAEARELEEQLDGVRQRARQVQGLVAGVPEPPAPVRPEPEA